MEKIKETKRKYVRKDKKPVVRKRLWDNPSVDGPSKDIENIDSWGPELEGFELIAGLYGVENNGSTSYFSRAVPRVNLSRCFDFRSKSLELLIVPDPYSENGTPDMYLYMRNYQYNRGKE